MPASVQIEGLTELSRALRQVDKGTAKAMRDGLREAAEPVRDSSERLALADIRNITGGWARMRTGVTTKEVYVAPAARRTRGTGRPNFGRLLMVRAMLVALKKHEREIADDVERALSRLFSKAGF